MYEQDHHLVLYLATLKSNFQHTPMFYNIIEGVKKRMIYVVFKTTTLVLNTLSYGLDDKWHLLTSTEIQMLS